MSDTDLEKSRVEVSVGDYLEMLDDHCKRRHLEPMMTKVLTMIAKNAASQPNATSRAVAESLLLKAKPLNERHRETVYEFIFMNFPEMVQGLYTPRVSTQEEILVGALAADVSGQQAAVLGGKVPTDGRSEMATLIDMAALDPKTLQPRHSLPEGRLATVHYVDKDDMAARGGIADILEDERKAAEKLAAERAAEEMRKKVLDEAAERAMRGRLDTLDPTADAEAAPQNEAKADSDEHIEEADIVEEVAPRRPASPPPRPPTRPAHARETLVAVNDAVLQQAMEHARKKSAQEGVGDEDDEEGLRPTLAPGDIK